MENTNQEKVKEIIRQEIQFEDDMLMLYSSLLKNDDFLGRLNENDKNSVQEIINMLLRGTARHKATNGGLINNL